MDLWVGKIPVEREWQLTPEFLPGESHRQTSLVGHSSSSHAESDGTEWLTLYFHKPCLCMACYNGTRNCCNLFSFSRAQTLSEIVRDMAPSQSRNSLSFLGTAKVTLCRRNY